LNTRLYRLIFTAQTFSSADKKYAVQRRWRKLVRHPSELDYYAFGVVTAQGQWVDVGANRGQTIDSIRLFSPDVDIVAFEPNPRLARRLVQQYESDGHLCIHPVALGEKHDDLTLFVPSYRGYVFDGLASLLREEVSGLLEDRLLHYNPARLSIEEIPVQVVKLDDFNLTPSLIKLDVQGLELPAIRGASETIAAHRPLIIVEASDENDPLIGDFLSPHGYRPFGYVPGRGFDAGVRDLNTFFLTEQHQSMLAMC
jgi:FkbM family methyltransferase